MGRKILAMAIGLITGISIFAVIAIISTRFGLAPRYVEFWSRAEMYQYWSSRPETVYILMLLGWMLASLTAGWITTKTAPEQDMILPLLVSAIMLGVGAVFFFAVTPGQPYWMVLLSLLSTVPVALLGHRFAGQHQAPEPIK